MCNVSSMVPWVVLPFIDCMQIKLSDGFQQFFFFFFEPYNFMGRTTWEFVRLFVKILQEDHVEKPLNHLWRSFILWRMLMYNDRKFIIHLPKKYIRRMDFLKSPFCLKLILRLIMALKFGCGFVEWILWECFNPLIHNVPKWSDTLYKSCTKMLQDF